MEIYMLYIYLIFGLFVVIGFRLRTLLFAWLDVVRSFGSKFLIRVKNKTQEYYASGRIDKGFLYFKGRKRPDNKDPNRMISTSYMWNPQTNKSDLPFNFNEAVSRFVGVNCVEVDDEKDCIIFYRNAQYYFVPGTNTELFDENLKTAQAKPSRKDKFMDERMFQIIVVVGVILCLCATAYVAYQTRILPNIFAGLIDTNNKVTSIYNVVINNVTGLPK
jgi:hypothetical protein